MALLQVEKKTEWKRKRGDQAKLVTVSHDVTLKRFSRRAFSAFWGRASEQKWKSSGAFGVSVWQLPAFLQNYLVI